MRVYSVLQNDEAMESSTTASHTRADLFLHCWIYFSIGGHFALDFAKNELDFWKYIYKSILSNPTGVKCLNYMFPLSADMKAIPPGIFTHNKKPNIRMELIKVIMINSKH